MNVLIIGSNGYLGPHVVKALKGKYNLKLTDIKPPPDGVKHDWEYLDVADLDNVARAAEGMDAIVNLSVLRHDRKLAFDVSTRGSYNMMAAAVKHGIRRVINTGPHFTVTGATYERFDHDINPDVPPQPGTILYALTKSLGHEVTRIFTENHDIYVMMLMFYHFRYTYPRADDERQFKPFTVTWDDAGAIFPLALDYPLDKLPSKFESFFVCADMPQRQFTNEKAKRVFGWQPTHNFENFWKRP